MASRHHRRMQKDPLSVRTQASLVSLALAIGLGSPAFAQSLSLAKDAGVRSAPRSSSAEAPAKVEPKTPAIPDLDSIIDFTRIHTQMLGDGSVQAMARSYKARFSTQGLTFKARGGDEMGLSLTSASIGGKPLAIDADAAPLVEGDVVSFDRGPLVERYAMSADSLEQLFTLNERPGSMGGGDLVLAIAARMPQMIATEAGSKFAFAGERGVINYSKAVLVDGAQARTNLATTVREGVIEIRVPSALLDAAQYPITIDPVVSSGLAYGLTEQYRHPDVAYDATSNRFVLVFEYNFDNSDGDIVSVLFDGNGVIVPGTVNFPDSTTDNWRNPSVANNNIANVFMVAAERGVSPTRGIWGTTISPATGAVGPQFQMINGGGGEKTNPDIGGDSLTAPPTYFLVVWEWAATPTDKNIAARLFTAAGVQQGGEIFLDLSSGNQGNPAISKSNRGDEWLVVWQSTFSPTDEDLYGALVAWNGVISQPSTAINTSTTSHKNPAVSSPLGTDRYLIAYEAANYIGLTLTNGTSVLQQTWLESLGDNPFGKPRHEPCVDTDGGRFIVGYSEQYANDPTDWDFYASTICASGDHLKAAEVHRIMDFSALYDMNGAVATAWSGGGAVAGPAVFGWTHNSSSGGLGTIYNARYNAHGSCCMADIAPLGGDGQINVADLLAVIAGWGPCTNCAADINGDFAVNVTDLLKVIADWGGCQ